MPVKKNISSAEPGAVRRKKYSSASKAKAQKNTKTPLKKVTRTQKARIQQTLESLPDLVIENSTFESTQKTANNDYSAPFYSKDPKAPHLNPLSFHSEFEEKKKRIVWVSVGTIMIFIFSLWVVNVRAQFTDADFHLGTEELLLNQAKQDFDSVLRKPEPKPITPTPEPTDEQDVEKIKNILSENLMNLNATSSTPTSTTEYTATSSVFTSSTESIVELNNEPSFEE